MFYDHYFAEVAAAQNLSMDVFLNPISMKSGSNNTNFNQKYFNNVFKSNKFLQDFLRYIKEELKNEYKQEIRKKLEILLRKWERSDPSTIDIKEAQEYLLKNKKCKLPWTIDEVNSSILNFVMMIKEVNQETKIDCDDFMESLYKS